MVDTVTHILLMMKWRLSDYQNHTLSLSKLECFSKSLLILVLVWVGGKFLLSVTQFHLLLIFIMVLERFLSPFLDL